MKIPSEISVLSEARRCSKCGDAPRAEQLLAGFARQTFDLECSRVRLLTDEYSLNSLSGILTLTKPFMDQNELFFKYHQEEDESKGVGEYYNSKLLEEASLPVDVPLAARSITGEQILLYKVRTTPRLADICRNVERGIPGAANFDEIVAAQRDLDRIVGEKYLETLHLAKRSEAAGESLHQLFFYRLVDGSGQHPRVAGGRLKNYYLDQNFFLPGLSTPLTWGELVSLRWRINGRLYEDSLGALFQRSIDTLAPANLTEPSPAVLGHGDAHNANVWFERDSEEKRLVFFDPAFAGAHLPALLAEVKATFHNIFAHPDWLYHPREAAVHLHAEVRRSGSILEVETGWEPGALRYAFLESKIENVWRPLLRELKTRQPSVSNASRETYIRSALFCCPTLVMNLRAFAGEHLPLTSAIGLSVAIMCGSRNDRGDDWISEFLQRISS